MIARFFICALLFIASASAGPVPTIWQRNISDGGPIIPTRDGGALVLGTVLIGNDSTDSDVRLIRLNARGDTLWQKDFGGSSVEAARDGVELPDGGFLVACETFSPISRNKTSPLYGVGDFWFLRVSANGELIWERSWGGTGRDRVERLHVFGNVAFAVGDTDSPISGNKTAPKRGPGDVCVVKLNLDGQILWDKTYGGSDGQYWVESLATNETRLYLITAAVNPPSVPEPRTDLRYYAWAVAIDGADGREIWNNSYSTVGHEITGGATFLNDGNIAMAGSCFPTDTLDTSFVTKFNPANGELIWRRELGTDEDFTAIAPGVRPGTVAVVTSRDVPRNEDYDDRYFTIGEYDELGLNEDPEESFRGNRTQRFGKAQTFVSRLRHVPGRGYIFATSVQRMFPDNTYGAGGDVLFWYLDEEFLQVGSLFLGGSGPEILSALGFSPSGEIFAMARSESDRSLTKTTPVLNQSWPPHNWIFKMPGWFTPNERVTELFIEPSALRDHPTGSTPLVLAAAQNGALSLQYSEDLVTWHPLETINFTADPSHATDPTRSEKRFYRLAPAN